MPANCFEYLIDRFAIRKVNPNFRWADGRVPLFSILETFRMAKKTAKSPKKTVSDGRYRPKASIPFPFEQAVDELSKVSPEKPSEPAKKRLLRY